MPARRYYSHHPSIAPLQRGHGLGNVFRGLFRTAMPMVKKGLLHLGKSALMAGANALQDVSENKSNLRDAVKRRAVEALHPKNLINRAGVKRKAVNFTKRATKKVGATSKGRSGRKKDKRSKLSDVSSL